MIYIQPKGNIITKLVMFFKSWKKQYVLEVIYFFQDVNSICELKGSLFIYFFIIQ
jgi:hypothetical protein